MFLNLRHPLQIALTLVGSSLFLGAAVGVIISSWFFITILIVFLGGMIVIFLYFTRLVSSEKLSFHLWKSWRRGVVVLIIVLYWVGSFDQLISVLIIFNFSFFNIGIIRVLIIYLLGGLFLVVKLTENFKGAVELTFY